jgi:hypothetical protein
MKKYLPILTIFALFTLCAVSCKQPSGGVVIAPGVISTFADFSTMMGQMPASGGTLYLAQNDSVTKSTGYIDMTGMLTIPTGMSLTLLPLDATNGATSKRSVKDITDLSAQTSIKSNPMINVGLTAVDSTAALTLGGTDPRTGSALPSAESDSASGGYTGTPVVKDSDGNSVAFFDGESGTFTFTMPASDVTVTE